jgi:hypothetical protein
LYVPTAINAPRVRHAREQRKIYNMSEVDGPATPVAGNGGALLAEQVLSQKLLTYRGNGSAPAETAWWDQAWNPAEVQSEVNKTDTETPNNKLDEQALARAIKVELDGIANGIRTTVQQAIKTGELLIQAKELLGPQRRFCKWCKKNFKVSSRTLQKYQRLALYVREAKAKSTSHLELEALCEGGFEAACYSACNFDPLSRGIGVQN